MIQWQYPTDLHVVATIPWACGLYTYLKMYNQIKLDIKCASAATLWRLRVYLSRQFWSRQWRPDHLVGYLSIRLKRETHDIVTTRDRSNKE